ncbi:high nitrogen upregulated cytochrome P450 monooxygenase 2 [Mycena polygramma]|nr:high nitrogen upregulated cytochrome P450 monooxygenase 2 [Mycena polygramma]
MEKYLSQDSALVLLGGVLTHLAFNRFEPHRPLIWAFLFIAPPAAIAYHFHLSYGAAALLVFKHLATLLLSVVVYRVSPFHPLAHIPGPFLFKISNLVIAYHSVGGRRNVLMEKLHKRYGKVVRIGSDQVSFADAQAAKICMGNKGLPRSIGYATAETIHTPGSILTSYAASYPDPTKVHAERRARWALAFTTKAIRESDKFLLPRVDRLIARLGEQEGVLDIGKWFGYFTFDFMGDLFFGGAFDMLNDQDRDGLWKIIEEFAPVIATLYYLPWLTPVLLALPGSDSTPINTFVRFAIKAVDDRLAKGSKFKDAFYYVAGEHIEDGKKAKPSREVIDNDVQTAIVGGSDTIASTLANTVFSLLMQPELMKTLQREIDGTFGVDGVDFHDAARLAELPYLNACINETLRVIPPVQTRISRGIPRGHGGMHVAGIYLPESTSIDFPPRIIHRDPEYFSPNPELYWPERWLPDTATASPTSEPFVMNTEGFMPFSLGPANCVGRNIAMREMRLVLAQLVYKYEIKAAEKDPREFERQWLGGLMDHQILLKGPLRVTLTPRSH